VAAHLYVRDLKASIDFFTTKLGFSVDFVYGDPPFYGQVSRDNARLALRWMDEAIFTEDIREREALLSASITLATAEEIKQTLPRLSGCGCASQTVVAERTVESQNLHREGPGRQSYFLAGPAN
jgi:hypothetical protein